MAEQHSLEIRNISKLDRFVNILNSRLVAVLFCILIVLGVITRLLPFSNPSEGLVFDESYFVPQVESYAVNRYFFDIHPPLGKMLMYFSTLIVNPDAAELLDPEKLANKVEDYKTPLDLSGIRLAPKIAGALLPAMVFLFAIELFKLRRRSNIDVTEILVSFGLGLFIVFANIIVVESRYGLQTPFVLLFMFLALLLLLKYANAKSFRAAEIWFLWAAFGLGLAVSTKWLALSIAPIFVLIILIKEVKLSKRKRQWAYNIAVLVQRFIFLGVIGLAVYGGIFYWHFNQLQEYSPAAWEVSQAYQDELRDGEKRVSFTNKFIEWHEIAVRYSENVPALDYAKSDEIGSMWATWPIMARPISYYWQTDGDGIYDFVFLIGNPLLWVISLMGALMLFGLGVNRVLVGDNGFGVRHLIIVLLYFGNWLPFAMIARVMYLYHFIPAYVFGLVAFALVTNDFFYPRAKVFYLDHMGKDLEKIKMAIFIVGLGLLLSVMGVFMYYSPFTYLLPLDKEGFEQRVLLKEWNMKWPG